MFFARFEDTVDQNDTTPQQRLEALKQKIAAKQKQHIEDTVACTDGVGVVNGENGVKNGEVSKKHPKKRRKISGAEECEEVKPKKKKKKQSGENLVRQECKRSKKEPDAISNDCEKEIKPETKKCSKKKKTLSDNVKTKDNSDISENDKPRKKKSKQLEISGHDHAEVKPNSDLVDVNDAPKQTKKKKKKKLIDQAEDSKNTALQEETTVGEQNKEPEVGYTNEITKMDVEDKTTEEEWTILGKHKKLQKVGHVKRDLPDWIVNCEIIDPQFENMCSVEEFGLLDQCLVDVLAAMGINSLFPVQSQIIPDILSGCQKNTMLTRHYTPPSDLCISAPTGSGKTLVYVLSLAQVWYI